jgi:hypothetical protein
MTGKRVVPWQLEGESMSEQLRLISGGLGRQLRDVKSVRRRMQQKSARAAADVEYSLGSRNVT